MQDFWSQRTDEGGKTPFFYLYILASIVYSVYTYAWDIKVRLQPLPSIIFF
jgi:hypothetical protein